MDTVLQTDICTFMVISHSFLLRMRNVSGKSCRENQNTFYAQYVFPENRSVCDVTREKISHGRQYSGYVKDVICLSNNYGRITDKLILFNT